MPVYEEKKKTKDGQKVYFIRTYITDEFGKRKQITRHNKKEWIGREGYKMAKAECSRLTNSSIQHEKELEMQQQENIQRTKIITTHKIRGLLTPIRG